MQRSSNRLQTYLKEQHIINCNSIVIFSMFYMCVLSVDKGFYEASCLSYIVFLNVSTVFLEISSLL
jgi:hypothetical protein